MLKIKNIVISPKSITPTAKYLFFGLFIILVSSFHTKKHPYYISVIDIKYNTQQKALQLSARMFTNDLEDALQKLNTKKIDVLNPENKAEIDSILFSYIKQRLNISINNKFQTLRYIGYEKEEESIWTYLEIQKVASTKTLLMNTKLLYDYLPSQVNIVHVEINGIKKSSKVTNPDSKVEFSF
ncbi:MAG: hypothetical protein JNM51_07845 [Bacteroidia bacterium]|nr:hypothetical protein [Bacteroidia bacterium]